MVGFSDRKVPQEIIFPDGTICAVNYRQDSQYHLSFIEENAVLVSADGTCFPVAFPLEPIAYNSRLSNGQLFKEIATVYGNTTLGFFNPGHCYYFNDGMECRFCSLGSAREETDHVTKVLPQLASEVIAKAIELEGTRIRRTLINGGNIRNYDKGFLLQTCLARAISEANDTFANGQLERHLISMPPKNLDLLENIVEIVDSLAMSLEIYDRDFFKQICPGKNKNYGRDCFFSAYDKAVEVLGKGNVYVGFVAGLEPIESLIDGMWYFANRGVVPAVAVFHPGRGSKFEYCPKPRVCDMLRIGREMQSIYSQYGYKAFIPESGRNSLDTEAQNGSFD